MYIKIKRDHAITDRKINATSALKQSKNVSGIFSLQFCIIEEKQDSKLNLRCADEHVSKNFTY